MNRTLLSEYSAKVSGLQQKIRELLETPFESPKVSFSYPLENSIGWLAIEKNYPIYVFGFGKKVIVVTEYYGREICDHFLQALIDDDFKDAFSGIDYITFHNNDPRDFACRFFPIIDDEYRIEYLRISESAVEIIETEE